MNIIFVGSLFPKDREEEIRSRSKASVDYAANNLQWAIIEGLNFYYRNLILLTLPVIGTFPVNYSDFYFKESLFCYKQNKIGTCLGFINLPIIKHFHKEWRLKKTLKKIVHKSTNNTIIIYSIHSPFLKAAIKLKKKNEKIKICLIVPDLPQYMSGSRNPIYLLLKKIDSISINKCLKEIDSFVLLSDFMYEALNVKSRVHTRIEGIFPNNNFQSQDIKKINDIKSILYTGTLDHRYGILNLLNAFSSIQNINCELWICGHGNCKNEIIQRAQHDNRIKYFGIRPHSEILIMQQKATVLVNPRTSEGEFTKYSFPSKTMEYLASGTPCIMHKLPGVPEEYFEYVYLSEKEDAEGLKNTIITVLNKTQNELDEFGKKASEFIIQNKNPIAQVKKIYDMINTL